MGVNKAWIGAWMPSFLLWCPTVVPNPSTTLTLTLTLTERQTAGGLSNLYFDDREARIGSNFDGRWTPGSEVRDFWLKYSYFPSQIPILISVIQKIRSIFLAVDREISKYLLLGVNKWVGHVSRLSFPMFAPREEVTQGSLRDRKVVGCDTIHCLFAECLNRCNSF